MQASSRQPVFEATVSDELKRLVSGLTSGVGRTAASEAAIGTMRSPNKPAASSVWRTRRARRDGRRPKSFLGAAIYRSPDAFGSNGELPSREGEQLVELFLASDGTCLVQIVAIPAPGWPARPIHVVTSVTDEGSLNEALKKYCPRQCLLLPAEPTSPVRKSGSEDKGFSARRTMPVELDDKHSIGKELH